MAIRDNVFIIDDATGELNVSLGMNIGPLEAEADSGAIVLFDMPVSATPAAGSEMSASIRIDGDAIIKAYAEADSAGGVQNKRVNLTALTAYANNAAAVAGGLVTGDLYMTSADPRVVCITV